MSGDTFRIRYYEWMDEATERYRRGTDRYKVYLVNGPPAEVFDPNCRQYLQPIQIFHYPRLATGASGDVFFYIPLTGIDYVLWQPFQRGQTATYEELLSRAGQIEGVEAVFYGRPVGGGLRRPPLIDSDCDQPERLRAAIDFVMVAPMTLTKAMQPAPVNEESMKLLLDSVVLADPRAPKLTTEPTVRFPRREGNRTDAELTFLVPRWQLALTDVEGMKSYQIDVTGEVVKEGRLFEKYRYRFDFPAETKATMLPVIIERFLPHGLYTFRVKVADAQSHAEVVVEREIEVPDLSGGGEAILPVGTGKIACPPQCTDTELRIVPLPDQILSGLQHIETIAAGADIATVEFYLDGKKVMTKRQPPYTLDVDVGDVPQPRKIRVIALDAKGAVLAGDEIEVNSGSDPFRVRIISPRVTVKTKGRTRVELAVRVPEGRKLDRVQLFYNDTAVATLYDPPFVQTIEMPATSGIAYLRAVGTLAGEPSSTAEDTVMINTPQFMEEVNVHLVELPTTVTRDGRPVNNLGEAAFKVLDEGKPVKVAKFEHVTDLPLSVGLAIDTSSSMQPRMAEARLAAAQFFRSVLKPGDKAFLLSFDVRPEMLQEWSANVEKIKSGLSRLRAEESTALYDAIVSALYNFIGVKGQKALILITDGKDTSSKFSFDQALEYARRASVPIYAIGIGIGGADVDTRFKLGRFCTETGGNVYYIQQASDLARIYGEIQNELRSQYILGIYPPDGVKPGSKWREVNVQVSEGKAKTIRGYYP